MSCYIVPCDVISWGLSVLLISNALILQTLCVLAITRNCKATKAMGTESLHTAIILAEPPILQHFASSEELPLYVDVMVHEPL